jgi:hypothetical protein
MRRTATAMLVGLLLLPALWAEDKPIPPGEQLEALRKEVEKVRQTYYASYEKATTDTERQKLRDKNDKQIKACARRALELARKYPKDPAAVEALCWIIAGGLGYNGAGAEIETALDLLRTDYVTSDKLRRVCSIAFVYDSVSVKPEQLLRAVLEKSPHRELRGIACYHLGIMLRRHAEAAKRWREPGRAKGWEAGLNAAVLKRLQSSDPDQLLQEAERLFQRTIAEYGDVRIPPRGTLADIAKATLFEMQHLVVGKTAPVIEGEDIDGKRFKLSDYRGKIVVLDFWGHW